MSETVVTLDGRTFRVGPCGFYEELIEVPLDSLVMSEGGQYPARVERHVVCLRPGPRAGARRPRGAGTRWVGTRQPPRRLNEWPGY